MKFSLRARQTLLATALVAACGLSMSAMAADGVITFTGKVVDQTCSLNSPSNTGGDFTVALDNAVKGTDLTSTNDTAKPKTFTMQFNGCPNYANISVLFSGSGIDSTGNNASNGLLSNTGTAAGVGIQLLGASSNPLDLSNTSDATAQGTAFVTPSSGVASFDYTAQYFVTDATTLSGGSVSSQVEYTVVYQ